MTKEKAGVILNAQGKVEATLRASAFHYKSDLRCRIVEAFPLPAPLGAPSRREGGRVGLDLQGRMAEEAGVGADMVEFHVGQRSV